jgi:hypothetical protein
LCNMTYQSKKDSPRRFRSGAYELDSLALRVHRNS